MFQTLGDEFQPCNFNVPAFRMGAFSADQEHFLRWVQDKGTNAKAGHFLPRKLYKEYIQGLVQQALRNTKGNVTLERVRGEVVDMVEYGGHAEIRLRDDRTLAAHEVVLAFRQVTHYRFERRTSFH